MANERGVGRESLQASRTSSPKRLNYLLVIGIDQYLHWTKLHNAVRDANEFANVLIRQYQFEESYTYRILDGNATERNIYGVFRELKHRIRPEDNLLIYFSGHGHYDKDIDEGFWVPVDATKDNEGDFISNSNIIKRINAIETHHTLMVIDSCFSGSLLIQKRNTIPQEQHKSRRVFTSGHLEPVSDGRTGENSPFAMGVLTYLRKNTTPALKTSTLVERVCDFVKGESDQMPLEGRLPNSGDFGGEFIFHLRKEEGTFWSEADEQNTVKAYQDYLDAFPTGLYVVQAQRRITKLREDEVWQTTCANDNESAYENYIRKYAPSGKYIAAANERLTALRQQRKERQTMQERITQQEQHREALQQEYTELVHSAEQLFAERQLAAARESFREALLKFLPGFVPNQQYLEDRINLCQTNITFLQHYDNGKRAMDSGNYRLAIQYFQEALKNTDNAQVESLLRECRKRLNRQEPAVETQARGAHATTTGTTTASPPKKKKNRRTAWWILGGILLFISIFVVFSAILSSFEQEMTDPFITEEATTTPEDVYIPEQTGRSPERPQSSAAAQNPGLADPKIFGQWEQAEFNLNGLDYNQAGNIYNQGTSAVYNFRNDGVVEIRYSNGNMLTYQYRVDNYSNIMFGYFGWGTYSYLDNSTVQLRFQINDGYYTYPLTITLER